ncbi:MAG: hypothetical protein Fur0037_10620 [Planctomycetota bacterium]
MNDPGDIDSALAFTVASVWREERVSCPHPDILSSFLAGGLSAGAREFVEFHLRESQCPYCNAVIEDLREVEDRAMAGERRSQIDRLLRNTAGTLRRSGA